MRTPPLLIEAYARKIVNRLKTQSMKHFCLKGQMQFSERLKNHDRDLLKCHILYLLWIGPS